MTTRLDIVEDELSDAQRSATSTANKNIATETTGVPTKIYELPVV